MGDHRMFIGHFGAGLIAKKAAPRVPLWILFAGATFIDLIHYVFLVVGLERIRVSPGFTAWVPLELISIPYTHSLVFALFWAIVAFFGVLLWGKYRTDLSGFKTAMVIALLVFSHYFLDVIVHVPDLALWPGSETKLGLGLWNYPFVSNFIEFSIFTLGLNLYYFVCKDKIKRHKSSFEWFIAFYIFMQILSGILPPPFEQMIPFGINLLLTFGLMVFAGWIFERKIAS